MGPIRGDPSAVGRTVATWLARWLLLVAIALAAVGIARSAERAATPQTAATPPAATVEMTGEKRFVPARVRVKMGDTVEWRNASSLTHTVTDDRAKARLRDSWALPEGAHAFDSGWIGPGSRWSYRFTVPGTYRYFCQPHEAAGMKAEVEVAP